ncbi:MAG: MFS transporter [Proteobacteria bacterium]|nr:MAG: MFS transporter [Pseudomonadota bacterium]
MLIFSTVAALALVREWGMGYAELIPYATPGFIAYALCTWPSGWLADRWSRDAMLTIFFIGIGLSSAATAMAQSPIQIAGGLLFIGIFASIYHPVGIAMVIEGRGRTGIPLAINGIFGNLGVASAALITGFLIDNSGWRAAFVWPGLLSVAIGIGHFWLVARTPGMLTAALKRSTSNSKAELVLDRRLMIRVLAVVFFSTAVGGLIFQSTTYSLPKVFDERLTGLAVSATAIGWYAFIVFSIAAIGQLIVGFLIDRYPVRPVFVAVVTAQIALFALMPGLTDWSAVVVSVFFMLAVFGQVPINDVLVGRITRSEWRSRVLALRYILTFSTTATAIPLIAWIYARWGFDMLFILMAAAAALIFVAVLMLPRVRPAAVFATAE